MRERNEYRVSRFHLLHPPFFSCDASSSHTIAPFSVSAGLGEAEVPDAKGFAIGSISAFIRSAGRGVVRYADPIYVVDAEVSEPYTHHVLLLPKDVYRPPIYVDHSISRVVEIPTRPNSNRCHLNRQAIGEKSVRDFEAAPIYQSNSILQLGSEH